MSPAISDVPLAEFPRGHANAPVPLSSRAAAAALTAALYGLILIMGTQRAAWMVPRAPLPEISVHVMPRVTQPRKPIVTPLRPFLAHLIKPPIQDVSPPAFAMASNTPPPLAAQPPSAETSAPLASGVSVGTGATQGGTATGVAGMALSGCYDAEWAQAVSNHVAKYFFYPRYQRQRHIGGVVFVHVGVRHNGRLAFLAVNRSSGNKDLDRAALGMVRNAEPLPRIPERMHLDRIDVELPVFFGDKDKNLIPTSGDCGPAESVATGHG